MVFVKEYQTIDFQMWMHDWLATEMGWLDWLKNTKLLFFECECWVDRQPRWICGSNKYLKREFMNVGFNMKMLKQLFELWILRDLFRVG